MNAPDAALPSRPDITEALARAVVAQIRRDGASHETLARVRAGHPGLRVTVCSDDDVPARMPAWLADGDFNVYLLDAGEHCVSLTTDPARACGLLVAQVPDED